MSLKAKEKGVSREIGESGGDTGSEDSYPNIPAVGLPQFELSAAFLCGTRRAGALAEKPVQAVILSSSEGSAFEFSSTYRFFVACWLLRMTVPASFSAACKARRYI